MEALRRLSFFARIEGFKSGDAHDD